MKMDFRHIVLTLILVLLAMPLIASGTHEEVTDPDLVIKIDGMYCALCSDAVKKSFESNEAVEEVSANHKTGIAYVVLTDESVDIGALTDFFDARLDDLGYGLVSVTKKEI